MLTAAFHHGLLQCVDCWMWIMAFSFLGTFAPGNDSSMERTLQLQLSGTFVARSESSSNFRSVEREGQLLLSVDADWWRSRVTCCTSSVSRHCQCSWVVVAGIMCHWRILSTASPVILTSWSATTLSLFSISCCIVKFLSCNTQVYCSVCDKRTDFFL